MRPAAAAAAEQIDICATSVHGPAAGLAMVQKGNVMAAMDELVRNVIAAGVDCENRCR
jgi:hypothetical protein